MSGKIDGSAVACTALGCLLIYSGVKGTSLTATLTGLTHGQLDSTAEASSEIPMAASDASPDAEVPSLGGQVPDPSSLPAESDWISDLLTGLGAPNTAANQASIAGWAQREGSWGTQGGNGYDPLNTELNEPGAGRDPQAPQIPEYTSVQQGLEATISTLEQGNFEAVRMALLSGQGLPGVGPANAQASAELSSWSGGGYSSV